MAYHISAVILTKCTSAELHSLTWAADYTQSAVKVTIRQEPQITQTYHHVGWLWYMFFRFSCSHETTNTATANNLETPTLEKRVGGGSIPQHSIESCKFKLGSHRREEINFSSQFHSIKCGWKWDSEMSLKMQRQPLSHVHPYRNHSGTLQMKGWNLIL